MAKKDKWFNIKHSFNSFQDASLKVLIAQNKKTQSFNSFQDASDITKATTRPPSMAVSIPSRMLRGKLKGNNREKQSFNSFQDASLYICMCRQVHFEVSIPSRMLRYFKRLTKLGENKEFQFLLGCFNCVGLLIGVFNISFNSFQDASCFFIFPR